MDLSRSIGSVIGAPVRNGLLPSFVWEAFLSGLHFMGDKELSRVKILRDLPTGDPDQLL